MVGDALISSSDIVSLLNESSTTIFTLPFLFFLSVSTLFYSPPLLVKRYLSFLVSLNCD